MSSINSNLATNYLAVPLVLNDVGKSGGTVRVCADAFEFVGASITDSGDYINLCRLPVNARLISARFWNDTMDGGSALTIDLGMREIDGTIVSVNAITNIFGDFQTATIGDGFEALTDDAGDSDNMGKTLWEVAGIASSPGGSYDLCLTISTPAASDVDGTLAFRFLYTID